jgi:hypothetical protein
MQILERIENKLDKESGSRKLGIHGSPRRKEDQEVVVGITVTPRSILIREHIATQVHPLSGSIRGLG